MERADVEAMLDILADNFVEGWSYAGEDGVFIYINNNKAFKGDKHIRIRKDTGILECLNGVTFYFGGTDTRLWRMSCEDFVKIVTGKEVYDRRKAV